MTHVCGSENFAPQVCRTAIEGSIGGYGSPGCCGSDLRLVWHVEFSVLHLPLYNAS